MTSDIARTPRVPGGGHEARDIDAVAILVIGFGLAFVIGLVLVISGLFFGYLNHSIAAGTPRSPLLTVPDLPAPPRLQVDPHLDLVQKRAQEDAALNSYGWVDRANGIVRIPIDHAIELTAERGLPVRKDLAGGSIGKDRP